MTESALYAKLQSHAKEHYDEGWDWVVEALDYRDFLRDIKEYSIATDWDSVLSFYRSKVGIRFEHYNDIAFEGY